MVRTSVCTQQRLALGGPARAGILHPSCQLDDLVATIRWLAVQKFANAVAADPKTDRRKVGALSLHSTTTTSAHAGREEAECVVANNQAGARGHTGTSFTREASVRLKQGGKAGQQDSSCLNAMISTETPLPGHDR